MGKKGIGLVLALGLFLGCMVPAQAETYYGDDSWHVAFTPEEEMESTFKTADLDEVVSGLQPGDNVIITLALENRHKETTDWYMTNKVLYSLEDRSANSATGGGAYTYRLAYTAREGETQGNAYQNPLADLQMNFAVELRENAPAFPQTPGTPKKPGSLVKTGDENTPLLLALIMAGSGLVLLGFCIFQWTEGRRRKKEEA